MKPWRTHLIWALVTVLVALAWGRHVSTRADRESRQEHETTPRENGVSQSNTAKNEDGGRQQKSAPLGEEQVAQPSNGSAASGKSAITPDQIRAMFKVRDQWGEAFEALKKIDNRRLKLSILGELFTLGHVDLRIPISAYIQLAEMRGPDAAEVIEAGLRLAEDDRMRICAVNALGQAGAPQSIGVLLESYHAASGDLKVASAAALNKLGNSGPAIEVLSILSRSLDNPDGAIRREAVENIASLTVAAAVPALTLALRDSNGDVRSEAISGLQSLGLPDVIPILEQATHDPNPSVAQDARNAIDRLRNSGEKRHP